jgi:2-dehydro-3-deoxyphosphogluconate aldolase / (4S)-4-hydroxy-2-oxoglutarate aldolase
LLINQEVPELNKQDVLNKLKDSEIVAVLRNMKPDSVVDIVKGLKFAGVNAIEITVETRDGLESLKVVKETFNEDVLLGAGTVLDGDTAKKVIDAGVDFIVTPIVSLEAIHTANRHDVFIGVGAMTPTEISSAYDAGADLVKVFPADSLGGSSYLKNVQGPLGHIPLMPTGGITLDNIGQYRGSGAVAVGVGSALYKYDSVEEITKVAGEFKKALSGQRDRSSV